MVSADFRYPVFESGNKKVDKRLNSYYRHIARTLLRRAKYELLPDAVDEWRFASENGYPFRPFEIVMKYTVTNNDDDVLSLYYDVYEYTGGAHGTTKRSGDTCALRPTVHGPCGLLPHGTTQSAPDRQRRKNRVRRKIARHASVYDRLAQSS
jgi:hypothetical protein